jgi:tetratricopeptide (TPR) repeat protein
MGIDKTAAFPFTPFWDCWRAHSYGIVSCPIFPRMQSYLIPIFILNLASVSLAAQTTNASSTPSNQPVAQDPFSDPLIQKVQARHQKAVDGDAKETKALTADLEKWTREQPNNHLLQAYLGSAYTLCSRDAWIGPGKLTYLQNGGKEMDAAVIADPNNPAVRFVRAIDYFSLPAIFGKRQTAREDFQILVKQVDGVIKTPYRLNLETRQAIYYYAGMSFDQLDEPKQAKETWERGLKLNPASPLGLKIQAKLKD